MTALLMIFVVAFVLSWIPALVIFFRTRRRFSGSRRVPCPETGHPALIRLDATHAAATGLRGDPEMKVEWCNRWDGPVGHCEEDCVRETSRRSWSGASLERPNGGHSL
jgi:hypothetical protein